MWNMREKTQTVPTWANSVFKHASRASSSGPHLQWSSKNHTSPRTIHTTKNTKCYLPADNTLDWFPSKINAGWLSTKVSWESISKSSSNTNKQSKPSALISSEHISSLQKSHLCLWLSMMERRICSKIKEFFTVIKIKSFTSVALSLWTLFFLSICMGLFCCMNFKIFHFCDTFNYLFRNNGPADISTTILQLNTFSRSKFMKWVTLFSYSIKKNFL
jgi:hypothetical protein